MASYQSIVGDRHPDQIWCVKGLAAARLGVSNPKNGPAEQPRMRRDALDRQAGWAGASFYEF